MIKVTIGTNVDRKDIVVDPAVTLRSVLDEGNIDYTKGTMHLDGAALYPGDLDRAFLAFNIKERCFLLNVAKADNGAN